MQLLNKENISKNQVDTIEQFKVLAYLKKQFNTDEVSLYLLDRFPIKLVDKNNDIGYLDLCQVFRHIFMDNYYRI